MPKAYSACFTQGYAILGTQIGDGEERGRPVSETLLFSRRILVGV